MLHLYYLLLFRAHMTHKYFTFVHSFLFLHLAHLWTQGSCRSGRLVALAHFHGPINIKFIGSFWLIPMHDL